VRITIDALAKAHGISREFGIQPLKLQKKAATPYMRNLAGQLPANVRSIGLAASFATLWFADTIARLV
jgi:hypothetical protein